MSRGFSVSSDDVSATVDGADDVTVAVVDLLSQLGDMHVDGAAFAGVILIVYATGDFLACDCFSLVRKEKM